MIGERAEQAVGAKLVDDDKKDVAVGWHRKSLAPGWIAQDKHRLSARRNGVCGPA